ncbi:hypothetical protein EB796_013745 [Bugula neritina]|uniref:Uncharacterized protein n=1 Tax=Bugula neritina TaxID=10212 RepID=A0A7J7JPK1_BUGNE|nr:hypothetical protein EB796_013745 [Bugula neritina]
MQKVHLGGTMLAHPGGANNDHLSDLVHDHSSGQVKVHSGGTLGNHSGGDPTAGQGDTVDDVIQKLGSPEVGVHSPTCDVMLTEEKKPDVDGQETIDYSGGGKTKDWSDPGNQ